MSGVTTGTVRLILRLEGACILIAALLTYSKLGFSWETFAWFFFTPDLSFLGYLAGSRIGAIAYNAAHSCIGALLCLIAGFYLPVPTLLCVGVIWGAHIGFDRSLSYGLKYSSGWHYALGSYREVYTRKRQPRT